MESTEFTIASGYASSSKVPPQVVCFESKWEHYVRELSRFNLPSVGFGAFLTKVCAPPCSPSTESVEGWKHILPCLKTEAHWELPVCCWNETERALRRKPRRRALLRGLQQLARECPERVPEWLRLSPHNFCRMAHRLGLFDPTRAVRILNDARSYPAWSLGEPRRELELLYRLLRS